MTFHRLHPDKYYHEINCQNCFFCRQIPGTVKIGKNLYNIQIQCVEGHWLDINGEDKTLHWRIGTWSTALTLKRAQRCGEFESMNDGL